MSREATCEAEDARNEDHTDHMLLALQTDGEEPIAANPRGSAVSAPLWEMYAVSTQEVHTAR